MLTFQFKLLPSNEQQKLLWKHSIKLNSLYNYFLNQKIENYKNKIKISKFDQIKELISLKEKDIELNDIHSQVLQQIPIRLEKAYKALYKKTSNYPKFRSSKIFFNITYPQNGYKIKDNIFKTKIYKNIKFIKHREILGNIKQVFISNKNNQFYLNIVTDYITPKQGTGKIGIDLGLVDLVVTNTGEKIKNQQNGKYFDKQIAKLQTRKSKTKKNSRKNKFLKKIINRLYELKSRKINDYQHKVSKKLASKYDTIYAEDLSVKQMSDSNFKNLNRSIRNAKLSQFINFLKYKVNNLVLVNPKNTSKTCNSCGFVHKSLKLSQRKIKCVCGEEYDRDINAAKNIYCLGQAMRETLCTEITIQKIFKKI